jgi:dTDP-glucose pyrophosphorylase
MKVMVFTSSYQRPYMLRSCIHNCKNQSYKDIIHTVNITSDEDNLQSYIYFYGDLVHKKLNIQYNTNDHTHFNNMRAIKAVKGYEDYDLFIKMDDDDIYLKDYVKNIVDFFKDNPSVDITSSNIMYQLNGNQVFTSEKGAFTDLGGNPGKSNYRMPMTYAFNKKAFDAIKDLEQKDVFGHDDMMWRMHWEAHGLKHASIDNEDEIIWHVHGKNVSTAHFLQ